MRIIWSPTAQKDLQTIVSIIARDKRAAALAWARKVRRKTSRLRRLPHSGRIVPELGRPEIREIIIGSYRIVYRLGTAVSILTVFHGAKQMDWPGVKKQISELPAAALQKLSGAGKSFDFLNNPREDL